MVVNVTDKEGMLKLGFGKMTKAGVLYKDQRIDWAEYVEIIGNIIICHFGTFELVNYETERDDKNKLLHMWTLKDVVTGKTYRIERNKVTKNKRLNNAWEVAQTVKEAEVKSEVVKAHEAFNFVMNKYKRPLAIPYQTDEEVLMNILEEVLSANEMLYEFFFRDNAVFSYSLEDKINLFERACVFDFKIFKDGYKKIVKKFHHDNGERPNEVIMTLINNSYRELEEDVL